MNIGRVIDISLELNEKTVVWRDDPQPKLTPLLRTPKDPVNFTWLDFGAHAGTHIDAPFFLYSDLWTADQVPLERLMGPCQVLDLSDVDGTIEVQHLKRHVITRTRLLLKTKNSGDPMRVYNPLHVDMSVSAAEYLVAHGITTLGFDYLSFEREGRNDVHAVFLSKSIIVIDNVRLAGVVGGEYTLLCLPVKITGTDGAPCRALLVEAQA